MTAKIIGILGGGQLGRMSVLAAARLGISCIVFSPEDNSPAAAVCTSTIVAPYHDQQALQQFAQAVDVITYEFENIPLKTIAFLSRLKPVRPGIRLLEISQDRAEEKTFLNSIGIPTARWACLDNEAQLHATLEAWKTDECIIKTRRFGYDGKGQVRYRNTTKLDVAIKDLSGDLIIEEIVDFSDELSVITARDTQGTTASYGPMLNIHKHHILHTTIAPAPLPSHVADEALALTENLIGALDVVGLLTLELFLTRDGRLLANEIAPRTHNSGHWSIDACTVSQFENHIRAVSGLPVSPPRPICASKMLNLIGDDIHTIAPTYLTHPGACVHLYGKGVAKPGRKMGHITFLKGNTKT